MGKTEENGSVVPPPQGFNKITLEHVRQVLVYLP